MIFFIQVNGYFRKILIVSHEKILNVFSLYLFILFTTGLQEYLKTFLVFAF